MTKTTLVDVWAVAKCSSEDLGKAVQPDVAVFVNSGAVRVPVQRWTKRLLQRQSGINRNRWE
jgi:hypothetical protein